jgi:hypothetical protein
MIHLDEDAAQILPRLAENIARLLADVVAAARVDADHGFGDATTAAVETAAAHLRSALAAAHIACWFSHFYDGFEDPATPGQDMRGNTDG